MRKKTIFFVFDVIDYEYEADDKQVDRKDMNEETPVKEVRSEVGAIEKSLSSNETENQFENIRSVPFSLEVQVEIIRSRSFFEQSPPRRSRTGIIREGLYPANDFQ